MPWLAARSVRNAPAPRRHRLLRAQRKNPEFSRILRLVEFVLRSDRQRRLSGLDKPVNKRADTWEPGTGRSADPLIAVELCRRGEMGTLARRRFLAPKFDTLGFS